MSLTCWTTLPRLRGSPHPPPPAPAPRCLRLRLPFPEEGVAARPGSCPTGWGARKLEGAGEPLGPGGGLVTWANLPQGNEVSSRLLGGNGGGRIRPRLTQAGRGISPRSLQPNPLPPPPPGRLRGTGAQRRESPGPPPPTQRLVFLSVPASPPPPLSRASRNCPPWGGAEGRGGCHPMGSGLAAKRRGSRGRRRARCAHLTGERVRHGPLAPRALGSWVQPAGRGTLLRTPWVSQYLAPPHFG